jgi:16S rRNA G966 N2-methylase RsmD
VQQRNHPAVFIKENLKEYDLSTLGKFDLIYCDPPWKEYEKRAKKLNLYDKNPEHYKAWTLQ